MITVLAWIYGISIVVGLPWLVYEFINAPEHNDWED